MMFSFSTHALNSTSESDFFLSHRLDGRKWQGPDCGSSYKSIDLKAYAHEQIFYDKWFDRVRGWTNFLWYISLFVCRQWLLDSGIANALGGKAEKMQKVIEKGY